MANLKKKYNENVDGLFFVDTTCIDCGTCYWMAPNQYQRVQGQSAVTDQPQTNEDEVLSYRALLSCPTGSIGTTENQSWMKKVRDHFPVKIDDNVYHLGFHARSSFGAASYFIKEDANNIMIDSPRYVKALSDKLKTFGPFTYQLCTHKDDLADVGRYQEVLGGKTFIHQDDLEEKSKNFDLILDLKDEYQLNKDITIIPVPGHTKGSVCFLYKEKFLFTGDHLAFSRDLGHLYAFKTACWYDFNEQINSMEKLLNFNFTHILPGHGAPFSTNTPSEMKEELKKCIKWMKS